MRLGHLVRVKSVVSARPLNHLLIIDAPIWVYDDIDHWMRSFFWAGKDRANGGQCLVAWNMICRLVEFGGLGVKSLKLQALALHVRWEWLRRTKPNRQWQGPSTMVDDDARAVFDNFVRILVVDGRSILFWHNRWIFGFTVQDIAPAILTLVPVRNQNRRTMHSELMDNGWTSDVQGDISFVAHLKMTHLIQAINRVPRHEEAPDHLSWPSTASGSYTPGSVCRHLCQCRVHFPYAKCIWRSWAPLKCKFFAWLTVQYRLWTSDRRACHGLQD